MSLIERGLSIQNRNRIMTGLGFLLRVTMRRHEFLQLHDIRDEIPDQPCVVPTGLSDMP
jgi:hypothetical protein